MAIFNKKTNDKKYMTAEEARSICEIGKENNIKEKLAFSNISDEEFEKAVKDYVKRCLERYIPSSAQNGNNHETIVPAHYKTANDDFERINRAREIIKEMVAPYGYTVSWFYNSTMISINW